MIHRIGLLLVLITLPSLALVAPPKVPEATAQGFRDRRGDDEDDGDQESRREERRRERGQFGGGNGGGFRRREGGGGGFGFRRRGDDDDDDRGGQRPARTSGGSSFGGGSIDTASYARRLVQENDKDGNMILNREEQSGLRGPAARADSNNDGVIDVDEIVAALSNTGARGAQAGGGGSTGAVGDRSRDGERDRGDEDQANGGKGTTGPVRVYTALASGSGTGKTADQRRTYRFTPAADRLPKTGLPSWFKTRDRNGDGQVAMNEYSRSWTERTANEFRRIDLNNDGMVTAKEATRK